MTAPRLNASERSAVATTRRAYAAARHASDLGLARDLQRAERNARRYPSTVRWAVFREDAETECDDASTIKGRE